MTNLTYCILDSHTGEFQRTAQGDLKIYKSRSSANRVVDRNNFIYGASRYYVILRPMKYMGVENIKI